LKFAPEATKGIQPITGTLEAGMQPTTACMHGPQKDVVLAEYPLKLNTGALIQLILYAANTTNLSYNQLRNWGIYKQQLFNTIYTGIVFVISTMHTYVTANNLNDIGNPMSSRCLYIITSNPCSSLHTT